MIISFQNSVLIIAQLLAQLNRTRSHQDFSKRSCSLWEFPSSWSLPAALLLIAPSRVSQNPQRTLKNLEGLEEE